jgi:Tol biopolymer transport system component
VNCLGRSLAALLVVLMLAPQIAEATFPGRNGRLFFDFVVTRELRPGVFVVNNHVLRSLSIRSRSIDKIPKDCRSFSQVADCEISSPALSPDGRWLAYRRYSYRETRLILSISRIDGSRRRDVTEPAYDPGWSPDGRRIVFHRPRADGGDLYVVGRSGRGLRRLTFRGGGDQDWSSRGRIAFARGRDRKGGHAPLSDIYSVTGSGGAPKRLTWNGRASNPSWSPDGQTLAFEQRGSPYSIRLMRANGRDKRVLVRNGHRPVWSPDGRWIAFYRGRDLFRIRPDGSALHRIYHASRRVTTIRNPFQTLDWQARPRRLEPRA